MDLSTPEIFMLALGSLGLGILMLLKGGTWTIDGAVFVAQKLHVSPLVIGFTIVAFGTSLPELIVSINANLAGAPGITIGNVIGSNIANILFVLGATGLFATLIVKPKAILNDSMMMIFATIVMVVMMLMGDITRIWGGVMVALLLGYVLWQYSLAKKGDIDVEVEEAAMHSMPIALAGLFFGLVFIALGAEFLVRGAEVSASILGVPDAVIGLTVIAIGTSLPELSTCVAAAMRKQTDLIIGNILGSNVFNILMIMGVTSIIKPIAGDQIAPQVVNLDIWIMLAVTLAFCAILFTYKKIDKPIGIIFSVIYVVYIVAIYLLYLDDMSVVEQTILSNNAPAEL